ncbi:MAG: hypothetical protein K2I23_02515, partial [Clostridia bacterium]|nr:hypothetical protein [Clostridia bacterium]
QPKTPEKQAPEAAQPKTQENPAPVAAQPKKQEKVAPVAAQPKKQEKAAPEAAQPKKQEKAAPVAAQPKKQENNSTQKANNEPLKKTASPKSSSQNDKSKASFVDDAVGTFTAELMRGYGWYEKSLSRKDYFQCLLDVNFEGKGKFELKSSQVLINSLKVDNFEINKLIKSTVITVKPGRNDLDIEVDRQGMRAFLANKGSDNINRFPTQISVTVIAMVKSGLTKTKKLPCDITATF